MIPTNSCLSDHSFKVTDPLSNILFFACDLKLSIMSLLMTQLIGSIFLSGLWMPESDHSAFIV